MKPVTHSVDTLVVCGNVRVTIAQTERADIVTFTEPFRCDA